MKMFTVHNDLLDSNARKSARLHRRVSTWHSYRIGLTALLIASAVHYVCLKTIGVTSTGLFFLYFMSMLIAAWHGYQSGLLVLFLAVAVLPYAYKPHFALSSLDRAGAVVLVAISLIVSRVSEIRHQTEGKLRSTNDELDRCVRLATADLEHRLAELETLYGQLLIGLCYLDADLRFVRINETFAALDGAAVSAHLGRPLREMVASPLADAIEELYHQVLHTGKPVLNFELCVPDDRNGHKDWMIGCSPVKGDEGSIFGVQVTLQDISERKRAEYDLRRTNDALRRANQDLVQFAYIAAHDLQEPLRSVVAFSQLIQRSASGKLDTAEQGYFQYVIDGAKRMSQLISGVLAYSQVSALSDQKTTRVQLADVCRAALRTLAAELEKKQAVVTIHDLPVIEADRSQMEQVFHHLLANALKYSRPEITPVVEIMATPKDNHWMIQVGDNGQGFKMEYADRIFGIFKRLHSGDVPGSGIGLAICKAVIERHGGNIWVDSQPDQGTTVFLTLPADSRPAEPFNPSQADPGGNSSARTQSAP